eukprot:CAMPEP_0178916400 /NCGR_PEP_ID=MMETSP0786-20121207/12615_1 /TAXON_ID=186022 /ORGANISM="Thalassionema frauenfeldii, Strain CCMP 1798" /LENGTH=133 /DNA_ID=CAMNT_0020589725 /DNA_START=274 /DNA_END=672 /DNA_ORIENTATION=-
MRDTPALHEVRASKEQSKNNADSDACLSESSMKDSDEKEIGLEPICPLFMEGLPQNFQTNPQLAALASLFDDGENDNSKGSPLKKVKGGKTRRNSQYQRKRRQDNPYARPSKDRNAQRSSPTISEAQLFLTMW